MAGPNWATILETLHDAEAKRAFKFDLQESTELSSSEIDEGAIYLQNARLATEVDDGDALVLTPRGFDVAHERKINQRRETWERQQANRQNDVNVAIALLTLGLLSIGAWDLIATIEVSGEPWNGLLIALAGVGLATLVAVALAVGISGLLTTESL